ncbi:oxygenase MpaB family protein (plasmid) [Arthrobacter sp. zg-Y820]|uniref:oxygenase MpaB family protein n=1 Tax=unclassified Arthrobacter TaxID=235627 RepID=UPI001E586325|nr:MULTISPECIES: oxygenase MpaB family protein [unclassified Arthrobacter]MCC9198510.1 DUF2236 domain-containing protein [Arthrobacter sp. zg-Y820]MDK1281380.1 oxygenase MpaB family protein [Arthrobacter sp. zg.Y820]WIB11228.1 oxygenase MpaB family protein [Arthrobacter sp. zg-Y820]
MRRQFLTGVHWRRRLDDESAAPWIPRIREGTDDGYFGPGSSAWEVNGGLSTFVGGIRALLIQALHPGALAGVHDHSHYREDTMGRLNRTIQWMATTTFGDRAMADAGAAAVRRMHNSVTGHYVDSGGVERSYSANDPHLVRWVHNAFTTAFLGAHEIWGGDMPGGPDQYVDEWALAGELMGVKNPPRTVDELAIEMDGFMAELVTDDRVTDLVNYLRRPQLPFAARLVYPILFAGAVSSLPESYRVRLGLRRPVWPAITACRLLLAFIGVALGGRSPSSRAAAERSFRLME